MSMYKPTELLAFLSRLGISPKKALSQNFLIDGNIIRKIVTASQVSPGDKVLEIGPGPGSLTQALLEAGAHVIAVEKDRTLAEALKRLSEDASQLEVFCEDILNFPLETKFHENEKVKVIANLPYNITTPILSYLVPKREYFSSLTLMVQEEVARRFTALPGNKDYSSFTVFLNFYTNPRYAFSVGKNCFYPKPRVDSAVVIFELKEPPHVENVEDFFRMTRGAFEQRRKMLRSSLKEHYEPSKIEIALESIGQNRMARPEDLSLEDFLGLYEKLNK